MAEFRWKAYETIQTYLSTELNSLAIDANKLGGVINNSSARRLYMDVEVYLNTIDLSGQDDPAVRIYLIASLDDTNYEEGTDSIDPTLDTLVKSVLFREANAIQRRVARGIVIPPGYFKLLIENKTGAAFNSANNTVKYRLYGEESN